MHDTGGHTSGGDTSSFTSHTSHTGYSSAGAPMEQNPNDVFYYANGGTSYANGGTSWPSNGANVRRGRSSAGVVVLLAIVLAAVLPILLTLIELRLI